MSKPREKWWSYVKAVIRDYPRLKAKYDELHTPSMSVNLSGMPTAHNNSSTVENIALRELPQKEQRYFDAVNKALIDANAYNSNVPKMIDLIYWRQTHTVDGAGIAVGYEERQARQLNGYFIRLVALYMGEYSQEDMLEFYKNLIKCENCAPKSHN